MPHKIARELVLAKNLRIAKRQQLKRHSHDPIMQNAVHFISQKNLKERAHHATHYVEYAEKEIQKAAKKIKKGMTVAIHGYSATILNLLKEAKKTTSFTAYTLDTNGEGRKMATELAKAKIKVLHFEDAATRLAIKDADILFLDGHLIKKNGAILTHVGGEMAAELADLYNCRVYITAHAWRYDSKNQHKHKTLGTGHWKAPKGVEVNKYEHETIDPKKVTAIISELGIHRPAFFIEEAKRKHPWMKSWF